MSWGNRVKRVVEYPIPYHKRYLQFLSTYCANPRELIEDVGSLYFHYFFRDTIFCKVSERRIKNRKQARANLRLKIMYNKYRSKRANIVDKYLKSGRSANCCTIYKAHYELLKDDPERLSSDFIKSLSGCGCK